MRRLAAPACVAAALLLYWVASWTSLAILLTRTADTQLEQWESGGSPWHWNFSFGDTVVWPGTSGFERTPLTPGALVGELPDGNADISLELWERGVDLELFDHALLWSQPGADTRAQLIAHLDAGPLALGNATLTEQGEVATIPLQQPAGAIASALRLHLSSVPGARISLQRLMLMPRAGVEPQVCADATNCSARVPLIVAPDCFSPEYLLDWRDLLLRERPAAIVRPPESIPTAMGFADVLKSALKGPTSWIMIALPVLGLIASHALRSALTRTRAVLELAAVFGPWLLLQWIGVDPDDAFTPRAYFAYWCALSAAVLIRDPTPDWRFAGGAAAWRAAGQFALLAIAVVGGTALANTADADGFVLRPPESDMYWRYPLWALVQQWIILRAIAPRMRKLCASDGAAALAVGVLFGLLHVPNFALMLATFAAGSCWAWMGYRHRALLPLAISHALLGLALFAVAPPWLLRSAEIGARYLMAP